MSHTFKALKNIPKRQQDRPDIQPQEVASKSSTKTIRILVFGSLSLAIVALFAIKYLRTTPAPPSVAPNLALEAANKEKDQAEAAFNQKNYALALQSYQSLVKKHPKDPILHISLGRVQRALQQPKKAEQSYRAALELNKDLALAWNNLGYLYMEQGEHQSAQQALEKAVELSNDTYADSFLNLGLLYEKLQNWDQAHVYYSKALPRLEDNSPEAKAMIRKLKILKSLALHQSRRDHDI